MINSTPIHTADFSSVRSNLSTNSTEQLTWTAMIGGLFNKGRLMLVNTSRALPGGFSGLFVSLQALFSSAASDAHSLDPNAETCLVGGMGERYFEFKQNVKWLNDQTPMIALRRFFMLKQTCDFALALKDWVQEKRSNKSMAHHTVNTILTWVPFVVYEAEILNSSFAVNTTALVTLSCLGYSAFRDIQALKDPEEREKSPTIELVRGYIRSFFKPSQS